MFPLPIFPTNGFDTSILTPVLVGMGFLAIFAETLGWPFVGLVVPGYIAAVAIAAPASAITILAESFATFFLSRVVGIWIPESGAWTTFFGRERFFLLILSSVVVRLASEGFVLPYLAAKFGFGYASELYSIGLVLVPLVANAFWNIGFARGLWQMAVVTGLTFLVIKWVLLPGTNLTLSRFELTYESVALDFLASSKAYVILLAGTMLAARSNVRFGWDFNGILVPGLLTVAWYDPVKLVSTFVEAFIVAWLARKVVGLPIFQRALIEGPRRTVLVFIVGYLVKYSEGFIAMFAFPGEQITDFYGFGYVLPSLLAVKVWQKTSPGRVLMPAFQVSVAGFLVGNLVGYLFTVAIPYTEDNALEGEVRMTRSASLTSDAALHVVAQKNLDSPDTPVGRSVIALVASARGRGRGIDFALRACSGEGLRVSNTTRAAGGQWWSLRRSTDGESGDGIPLVAVTRSPKASGVVLGLTAKDSRGVIVASRVANAVDAAALVIAPAHLEGRALDAWVDAVELATGSRLLVRVDPSASGDVELAWTPAATAPRRAATQAALELVDGDGMVPSQVVEAMALRVVAPFDPAATAITDANADLDSDNEHLLWERVLGAFQSVSNVESADMDERRTFSRVLAPAVQRWRNGNDEAITPTVRFVAHALGLRMTTFGSSVDPTLLVDSEDGRTRDLSWSVRRGSSPLVLSVPGGTDAVLPVLRYADTAMGADQILVARRPSAHSLYRSAARHLLGSGAEFVAIRTNHDSNSARAFPIVLSVGDVVRAGVGVPEWTKPTVGVWSGLGVEPVWYDGRRELWSQRGSTSDVLLSIQHPQGRRNVLNVWVAPSVFATLAPRPLDATKLHLWEAAGWGLEHGDVASLLEERSKRPPVRCEWDAFRAAIQRYVESRNWHALATARRLGCEAALVEDQATQVVYVVARPDAHARAARIDARGVDRVVEDVSSARIAVLGGAQTIVWEAAP